AWMAAGWAAVVIGSRARRGTFSMGSALQMEKGRQGYTRPWRQPRSDYKAGGLRETGSTLPPAAPVPTQTLAAPVNCLLSRRRWARRRGTQPVPDRATAVAACRSTAEVNKTDGPHARNH